MLFNISYSPQTNRSNKLERLLLASLSKPGQPYTLNVRPAVNLLKGFVRSTPGWKGLTGTNALFVNNK